MACAGRTDLLEADVHVKGEGLPGVAHWGGAELSVGGGNAGDELHSVRARIISDLKHKYTHTPF